MYMHADSFDFPRMNSEKGGTIGTRILYIICTKIKITVEFVVCERKKPRIFFPSIYRAVTSSKLTVSVSACWGCMRHAVDWSSECSNSNEVFYWLNLIQFEVIWKMQSNITQLYTSMFCTNAKFCRVTSQLGCRSILQEQEYISYISCNKIYSVLYSGISAIP
jgi:hypothetical protein